MTAGDGPFRVVVSRQIDGLGIAKSQPAIVNWHWYYHLATAPLWAIVLLSVIAFRENRNAQAWLIVIPLAIVLILWRTPLLLFGIGQETIQSIGSPIFAGAMGWTLVWLFGDRLANRRFPGATVFLIILVMFVFGGLAFFALGGLKDSLFSNVVAYGISVGALVLSMAIAAHFSRNNFTPVRFGLWLLLWIALVSEVAVLCVAGLIITVNWAFGGQFLILVFMASILALIVAGIIYVANLPFLILIMKSPFYRARFDAMFHIPSNVPAGSVSEALAEDASCPFGTTTTNDLPETTENQGGSN
jgi:hypothetical protein